MVTLIIVLALAGRGFGVTSIEYSNQAACDRAQYEVMEQLGARYEVTAICLPKVFFGK